MSRLYKQIQQAQAKEQVFKLPSQVSPKKKQKFNLLPFLCIISLLAGIVVAYFYTDQDPQPSLSEKETHNPLPVNESPESLAEDIQQPFPEATVSETATEINEFENIFPEKRMAVNVNDVFTEEELIIHPFQWDIAPFKDWIQEHLESTFPVLQKFRDNLRRFAYLDVTQPIPEKEISSLEKERLELIRRFLKRFKIDAVRIDGSYSRVMANGQAYYVNTVVSQKPRLKLTSITSQEMIFKDEYNQEYKKEISQND